jgi:hypothetical protein
MAKSLRRAMRMHRRSPNLHSDGFTMRQPRRSRSRDSGRDRAMVLSWQAGRKVLQMAVPRLRPGLLATAILILAPAAADARPDTRSMTCGQAQALVQNSGSVVLTTGPHVYGEVVAASSYCRARIGQAKFATTRDNAKCQIGYVCLPYSGGNR